MDVTEITKNIYICSLIPFKHTVYAYTANMAFQNIQGKELRKKYGKKKYFLFFVVTN